MGACINEAWIDRSIDRERERERLPAGKARGEVPTVRKAGGARRLRRLLLEVRGVLLDVRELEAHALPLRVQPRLLEGDLLLVAPLHVHQRVVALPLQRVRPRRMSCVVEAGESLGDEYGFVAGRRSSGHSRRCSAKDGNRGTAMRDHGVRRGSRIGC